MKEILFFVFLIFPFFILAADGVEINTAPLKQLETLAGVGPVIGQRIIDARPFSSVDDLLRVKGIGEKTLQKIKDQGLAYVENGAMAAKNRNNRRKNSHRADNSDKRANKRSPCRFSGDRVSACF